jgi:alpha-L-rhamnosidase
MYRSLTILAVSMIAVLNISFTTDYCNNGEKITKSGSISKKYSDKNTDAVALKLKSSMIWDASTTLPDTVPFRQSYPVSVGFRKTFMLPETAASAVLHLFADARYVLWINGEYIARGPNRFDPKRVEYDTHEITRCLRKGKNTIAILVQSGLSNYRFIYHKPGLGAILETKSIDGKLLTQVTTDTTWRSSTSIRFGPPLVLLSGIHDDVDEHRETADWLAPEFDDSLWKTTVQTDGKNWGKFCKRQIPLLRETPVKDGQILEITQGTNVNKNIVPVDEAMPLELTAPA